jgi:hypothetical protein
MFGNGHIDDDHHQRNSAATCHKAEKVEGNSQTQRNSKIKILAFLRFFSRTPKKSDAKKNAAPETQTASSSSTAAKNISEKFRQPSPLPPRPPPTDQPGWLSANRLGSATSSELNDSISDTSLSKPAQNPPKPKIIGKMWRTPKKKTPNQSSGAASPQQSRKKAKGTKSQR